jgi:hypothetical protein
MTSISGIIKLVSLGFAGVAVALALLSYQLLRAEQRKKTHDAAVLAEIARFGRRALLIAVLVAVVQLAESAIRQFSSDRNLSPAAVSQCRDSLSKLQTQADSGSDLALRAAARAHYDSCKDLLAHVDQQFGR